MEKMYIGTMGHTDKQLLKAILTEAFKCGYFGVDAAWIYKNEALVGEALEELRNEGIDMRIQTKIWTPFFDNVAEVFAQQLKDLRVNKVYSLLLHRPSLDFNLSIKAWKDLIELQKQGKVEHIGVSNFDKDMIKILIKETGVKPEFNQVEMSLTNFREDRLYTNKQFGIETQGWSVFGNDPVALMNSQLVKEITAKYNITPGSLMVSFLTTQGIVPIVGTHKVARICENANTVKLSEEDIKALKTLNIYDNKFEETYPY